MVDMKEIVAACVNYIEDNIYTKITLDDIAGQAGISKYHLHRMFKSLTGESLMDYVHSRKLSASINELIHTNMRIIDIALEYGFDYEQSYIRAFRKKFGHTPLKVRVENLSFIITEKLNVHDILSVNNSIIYKPFFVYKPKMRFNPIILEYSLYFKPYCSIALYFITMSRQTVGHWSAKPCCEIH